jgi:HK97 family phage prohead protease
MDLNNKFVRRSFSFDVRAEENGSGERILTGCPIVYNSRTDLGCYDEIIESGALNETDLRDVRFLVNHDTKMIPLARSRRNNGNSTMKLTPDFEGLNIDFVKLDVENNSTARALFSAVKRGDISGMSFMFSIDKKEWDNLESDHPTCRILKIGSVVEISACTFPAYDSTEINARSKEELDSARSALEKARQRRDKSVDTDELTLLKEKIKLWRF